MVYVKKKKKNGTVTYFSLTGDDCDGSDECNGEDEREIDSSFVLLFSITRSASANRNCKVSRSSSNYYKITNFANTFFK